MTANTHARVSPDCCELQWVANNTERTATSVCGRYKITWGDNEHGRWFNAWYGDSPRQHLTGSWDKEIAKVRCEQHARKLSQP